MDYVFPLAAIVNTLSMVIIAAAGRMETAEYLFYLVQAGVCGLIPFILLLAGAAALPYPSVICSGVRPSVPDRTSDLQMEGFCK